MAVQEGVRAELLRAQHEHADLGSKKERACLSRLNAPRGAGRRTPVPRRGGQRARVSAASMYAVWSRHSVAQQKCASEIRFAAPGLNS